MKTTSGKPSTGHGIPSASLAGLVVAALAAACGPAEPTTGVQVATITVATHTPPSVAQSGSEGSGECSNDYFPADEGASWTYSSRSDGGTAQERTVAIASSSEDGFTVDLALASGATFVIEWSCSDGDLTQLTPTAALSLPGGVSATAMTINHSGVTLPADLDESPSWQESGAWTVQTAGNTIQGSYASNNTAVGTEVVTVPFGTFEAMRIEAAVEGTLNGEPTPTCQVTQWWAKDVGLVRQETTCPVGDQSMTEVVELVSYDSP